MKISNQLLQLIQAQEKKMESKSGQVSIVSNEIHFNKTGTFEICLFNLLGRQVKHFKTLSAKGHILPLNVKNGIYILQIKENHHFNNYKILIGLKPQ